jgi:hypothetical protein
MAGENHSVTIVDYNGETSTTTIHVGGVTAASLPGLLTDIAAWRAAITAVIVGNQRSDKLTAYNTNLNPFLPTSTDAQVERKWQINYVDSTPFFDDPVNAIPNAGYGKTFQVEIATADSSLVLPNSEYMDVGTGTPGEDLVDAFETIARSPYGGSVSVTSVILVGRTR